MFYSLTLMDQRISIGTGEKIRGNQAKIWTANLSITCDPLRIFLFS